MVSRYLALSGIPLSQISILTEIQKLASFLLDNIPETMTTGKVSYNITGINFTLSEFEIFNDIPIPTPQYWLLFNICQYLNFAEEQK